MNDELIVTPQQDIIFSSFRLHEYGIEPIGDPTFEQWIECGNFISKSQRSVHFWLGDWLNYGERKWGERYKEALEKTRFDYGTLRNDKWVASRVPLERRKENLSFDHHQAVAELPPDEQDAFLQVAVEKRMNSKELRKSVDQRQVPSAPSHLSGRPDKLQMTHAVLDANDTFVRQLEQCDVAVLGESEKQYMLTELTKTQEILKQFILKIE